MSSYFSQLLFFIVFTSYSCNNVGGDEKNSLSQVHYKSLEDSYCIIISADTSDNYIVSIIDTSSNYLSSVNGCGNCFIESSSKTVIEKKFSENAKTYIVVAGDKSSTYGSKSLFIIWKNLTWGGWEIYKVPFDRFGVRDLEKDGINEIIEYLPSDDSVVYNFSDGILHHH